MFLSLKEIIKGNKNKEKIAKGDTFGRSDSKGDKLWRKYGFIWG